MRYHLRKCSRSRRLKVWEEDEDDEDQDDGDDDDDENEGKGAGGRLVPIGAKSAGERGAGEPKPEVRETGREENNEGRVASNWELVEFQGEPDDTLLMGRACCITFPSILEL